MANAMQAFLAVSLTIAFATYCGRHDPFEPDLKQLDLEVKEIFRKEAARDAEGMLRHWRPCVPDYKDKYSSNLRNSRTEIGLRLAIAPPLDFKCEYRVVNRYGNDGRFVDSLCKVNRGGKLYDEVLFMIALPPGKASECKYRNRVAFYRPLIDPKNWWEQHNARGK